MGKREDYISKMGYRDDSPFNDKPFIDINTPNGIIDMSKSGRTLRATDSQGNTKVLKPYSGQHQFAPGIVREELIEDAYEDVELTDEEIKELRDGGYVVEELPKAQNGKFRPNLPEIANDTDSSAVAKSSIALKNFYTPENDYYEIKGEELQDVIDLTKRMGYDDTKSLHNFNDLIANEYNRDHNKSPEQIEELTKTDPGYLLYLSQGTKEGDAKAAELKQWMIKYKAVDPTYRIDIDENKYKQRDLFNGTMNREAPIGAFDKRIEPQSFKFYRNGPEGGNGEIANIAYYDPLAVTPWNDLSPEDKVKRVEQYGTTGTPDDPNYAGDISSNESVSENSKIVNQKVWMGARDREGNKIYVEQPSRVRRKLKRGGQLPKAQDGGSDWNEYTRALNSPEAWSDKIRYTEQNNPENTQQVLKEYAMWRKSNDWVHDNKKPKDPFNINEYQAIPRPEQLQTPSIEDQVYSRFPALRNMGEVTFKADPEFTREATGIGDIEYFGPGEDRTQITYPNNFVYKHPKVGTHGIVYNPETNNAQSIALDMLHGLSKDDKNYEKFRNNFGESYMNSIFREDFERDVKMFKEEIGEDKFNEWYDDDKDYFKQSYLDGVIRNLLFEGTPEDFKESRYWEGAREGYLAYPELKETFTELEDYLKTPTKKHGGQLPKAQMGINGTLEPITLDDNPTDNMDPSGSGMNMDIEGIRNNLSPYIKDYVDYENLQDAYFWEQNQENNKPKETYWNPNSMSNGGQLPQAQVGGSKNAEWAAKIRSSLGPEYANYNDEQIRRLYSSKGIMTKFGEDGYVAPELDEFTVTSETDKERRDAYLANAAKYFAENQHSFMDRTGDFLQTVADYTVNPIIDGVNYIAENPVQTVKDVGNTMADISMWPDAAMEYFLNDEVTGKNMFGETYFSNTEGAMHLINALPAAGLLSKGVKGAKIAANLSRKGLKGSFKNFFKGKPIPEFGDRRWGELSSMERDVYIQNAMDNLDVKYGLGDLQIEKKPRTIKIADDLKWTKRDQMSDIGGFEFGPAQETIQNLINQKGIKNLDELDKMLAKTLNLEKGPLPTDALDKAKGLGIDDFDFKSMSPGANAMEEAKLLAANIEGPNFARSSNFSSPMNDAYRKLSVTHYKKDPKSFIRKPDTDAIADAMIKKFGPDKWLKYTVNNIEEHVRLGPQGYYGKFKAYTTSG